MSFDVLLNRKLKEVFWIFGVPGRFPFSTTMRLMPDGSIAGYSHPNERSWKVDDHRLLLLNENGDANAVFESIDIGSGNEITITGTFVHIPGSVCTLVELSAAQLIAIGASNTNVQNQEAPLNVARSGGLGDVLMLTAALREYKKQNPEREVNLYTQYTEMVKGLRYIDNVFEFDKPPDNVIFIGYEHQLPPFTHISKIMGYQLGVAVENVVPDFVIDQSVHDQWSEFFLTIPEPHFVVLRRASRWTPNKDWPAENWASLIDELVKLGSVIEIGERRPEGETFLHKQYWDFCGNTSIGRMAGLLAAADLFIGPVSGPLHLAAAVGTPSVVIIGGYEHPAHTHYPGNVEIYRDLPCAPCWLRTPCPIDRQCLGSISVQDVLEGISSIRNRNKMTAAGQTAPQLAS